jgi:hypothetical protein
MSDEHGALVASGVVETRATPPDPHNGWHFESVQQNRTRFTVDYAAQGADVTAPSITSIALRDTTLAFSAGDYSYGVFPRLNGPVSATVSWRVSGTKEWTPLVLTPAQTDLDDRTASGHWPMGYGYTADLSAAFAHADSAFDLRFEVTDTAGNRTTWIEERALSVGNPPPPPGAGPRRGAF